MNDRRMVPADRVNAELLPCPWCGERPIEREVSGSDETGERYGYFEVCCYSSSCPATAILFHSDIDERDDARKRWNSRSALARGARGELAQGGMVPAGPSDEEIRVFDGALLDLLDWIREHADHGSPWRVELTKRAAVVRERRGAALARWRAQTECDPVKVEAVFVAVENGLAAMEEEELDAQLLVDLIEAARSSRRPRGRVVEGFTGTLYPDGFVLHVEDDSVCSTDGDSHAVDVRIEILDAPEEG